MRAYKEIRDFWKRRIVLTPENEEKLMSKYKIARYTLGQALDLNNPNNTRPKVLDIQVDAINDYGGQILSELVRKPVLVIDNESSPVDFSKKGRKNVFC